MMIRRLRVSKTTKDIESNWSLLDRSAFIMGEYTNTPIIFTFRGLVLRGRGWMVDIT